MSGSKACMSKRKKGKEMGFDFVAKEVKDTEKKQKNMTTTSKWSLISYEELPDYMKDNEYILRYYRANFPLKQALLSIFRLHNETLNIWTHLIGFLLFLGLTVLNLEQMPSFAVFLSSFSRSFSSTTAVNASHNHSNFFSGSEGLVDMEKTMSSEIVTRGSPAARWPFFVFLAGSMFCLLSSSTCHLFSCHSHRLNLFLLQVDYAGIAVMIVTSFFPPIFYIFQCERIWQFIYLAGITTMGIFTIFTLLSPTLSTSKYRFFRAMLFSAMGFSGIIPAIHAIVLNWSEPRRAITLAYEIAMALSYVTGTMFYVSRIPEKWKPGFFDLAGHSHQIFHVFVILGALAHYAAALVFIEWRDSVGCNSNM